MTNENRKINESNNTAEKKPMIKCYVWMKPNKFIFTKKLNYHLKYINAYWNGNRLRPADELNHLITFHWIVFNFFPWPAISNSLVSVERIAFFFLSKKNSQIIKFQRCQSLWFTKPVKLAFIWIWLFLYQGWADQLFEKRIRTILFPHWWMTFHQMFALKNSSFFFVPLYPIHPFTIHINTFSIKT